MPNLKWLDFSLASTQAMAISCRCSLARIEFFVSLIDASLEMFQGPGLIFIVEFDRSAFI